MLNILSAKRESRDACAEETSALSSFNCGKTVSPSCEQMQEGEFALDVI